MCVCERVVSGWRERVRERVRLVGERKKAGRVER